MLLESENLRPQCVSVSIRNASARWATPKCKNSLQKGTKKLYKIAHEEDEVNDLGSPTLIDLNAEFPNGKLIGIIGPVGAGKTSLLQLILGELPLKTGSLDINGTMSYARY